LSTRYSVLGTRYSVLSRLFPFSPWRDEESVTWHKHWFLLVRGLAPPAIIWALAVAAWFASIIFGESGQFGSLPVILGWIVVASSPVCLLWALWSWDDWGNDIYRLDGERIYDIERLPLGLREQSKETLVTRVTDVSYVIPGPLASVLNFGDVVLRTPGESTEFVFRGIPRPREVQREIMDRLDEYRLKAEASTDQEIAAWLKAYHDVRAED